MKYLITLALFGLFQQLFGQYVSTIDTIETNFGDGMLVTPEGDILVSGGYNKTKILKITLDGVVSDFVTGLPGPVGMGYDSDENLYVANYSGNSISKVTPEGQVSEFASGLDGPAGLIVNNDIIYVTLYGANFSGNGQTVLKFDLDGNSEIYASGEGIMDAIGITMDENQVMYVTNYTGGNVYSIDTNQTISSFSSVTGASINQIVYANNYVYIPSPNLKKIYRVNTTDSTAEHYAGTGANQVVDGPLLEAQFNKPNSCAISQTGDTLYILDGSLGRIRMIDMSNPLGINSSLEKRIYFNLEQNHPNPFSSITSINFSLAEDDLVNLSIYNLQGQMVEQLINESMLAGNHSVQFNASYIPDGFYFYQLTNGKFSETKKLQVKR